MVAPRPSRSANRAAVEPARTPGVSGSSRLVGQRPAWDDMAVVGQVARPHGIRGQVIVNPLTDFPHDRFKTGAELFTRRAEQVERLTLTAVRFQGGRPIVGWAGIDDINAVLAYVGAELRVPREWLSDLPRGTYYRHDLVGCSVTTVGGHPVGVVREVEGPVSGSCLVIDTADGEVLVPLASNICTSVDIPGRMIVIDPPAGLLELNQPSGRPRR